MATTTKKTKQKPKGRKKQTWCTFTQVSEENTKNLVNSTLTPAEEKEALAKVFVLDAYPAPVQSFVLELYHKVLTFGKKRRSPFDAMKLSTLLGIFSATFDKTTQKDMSQKKFYDFFKQLLLAHSVERPPHSLCIFSAGDVKEIADLFVDDFYKLYPLYHYIFHPKYELALKTDVLFKVGLPDETSISTDMKEIKPQEIPDLRKFIQISAEEAEAEAKAKEMEEVMNVAKSKLDREMEERMKKQDEDFMNEVKAIEGK